jgi:hypothetical protein
MQTFYFPAQAQDFLVFLEQHGQQENLERLGVGRVGRRRQVLMSGCEQVVENRLVAAPQGTPEPGESALLLQEYLGDGG